MPRTAWSASQGWVARSTVTSRERGGGAPARASGVAPTTTSTCSGRLPGELLHQGTGAVGERDQRHLAGGEAGGQVRGDHATLPRTPVEDLDEAAGAAATPLGGGDLGQDLVGHGIGGLADVAGPAGDRREQADHPEGIAGGGLEQGAQPLDLGREDPLERVVAGVDQEPVGDHPGAVDEGVHRAPRGPHRGERLRHRHPVADVHLEVADGGPRILEGREIASHLAGREEVGAAVRYRSRDAEGGQQVVHKRARGLRTTRKQAVPIPMQARYMTTDTMIPARSMGCPNSARPATKKAFTKVSRVLPARETRASFWSTCWATSLVGKLLPGDAVEVNG